jgi:hypothetical protein
MGETTQEVSNSLLSIGERRAVVQSFVDAFIRGKVAITIFSSPKDQNVVNMSTGQKMTLAQISSIKHHFLRSIETVSGMGNPSKELVDAAVDGLFATIVSLRSGGFIEGQFLEELQLGTRITKIEDRVGALEKLIEELQQIWRIRGSG